MDKNQQAHDLALIYAHEKYKQIIRIGIEQYKNDIPFEATMDTLHHYYMEAFCEYSNYADEMFDPVKYLESD